MPIIAIIIFAVNTIEARVKRSKPRYIGFLLNLYNPFILGVVFSEGRPSLVELPKLMRLITTIINPIINNTYDKILRNSIGCLLIIDILNIDAKEKIHVM